MDPGHIADPFAGIARVVGVDASVLRRRGLGEEFDPLDYYCGLQRGDEVAVNHTRLVVGAGNAAAREERMAQWRHGIYVGAGRVVDFGFGDSLAAPATVWLVKWSEFCGGSGDMYTRTRAIKVTWPGGVGRTLEESAAAAEAAVGRRAPLDSGATWCRLGMCVDARSLDAALHLVPAMARRPVSACPLM
jgi:hypothetical protein